MHLKKISIIIIVTIILATIVLALTTSSKEYTFEKQDKDILNKQGYVNVTLGSVTCYQDQCHYYVYRGEHNKLKRNLGNVLTKDQTEENLKVLQDIDYQKLMNKIIYEDKLRTNYTSKTGTVNTTIKTIVPKV
jgi:uncharacterized protein YpmB